MKCTLSNFNYKANIFFYLFAIILLLTVSENSYAQASEDTTLLEPSRLIVLAKHDGTKNILRWAPKNYALWQAANENGYFIDRFELSENGLVEGSEKRLTTEGLVPLSIEQWKERFEPENKLAAVAVQTLYGSTEEIDAESAFGGIVSQHMQQQNLFGFGMLVADASAEIANGMALRYDDYEIDPNKIYVYRIHTNIEDPNAQLDTAWIVARNDRVFTIPKVNTLSATEGEKQVMLKWSSTENVYPPSGYFIEQSLDGGKTFERINEMPHIAMTNRQDSLKGIHEKEVSYQILLEENYQPIQYRVLAFNAFGEVSENGNIITAQGIDRTPPPQPRMKNLQEFGDALIISWNMPDSCEALLGFAVGHSNNADGPFYAIHDELLDSSTRSWIDEDAKTRVQNYYIVSAIDTAHNISNSLPVYTKFIDSIPPAPPVGLEGSVDSLGWMNLSWTANEEEDLLGYSIWFANQADHEFIQINNEPFKENSFKQQLNLQTLTEDIFYQVVALDINMNPSDRSEIKRLEKPDIIAPVSPQIHTSEIVDSGISLSWHNSPSKDVASHIIQRSLNGNEAWEDVQLIEDLSTTEWKDESVNEALLYHYRLIAIDDDGLRSEPSRSIVARKYHSSVKDGVSNLTLAVVNEKHLELKWDPIQDSACRYFIYRADNEGKLQLIKSVNSDYNVFIDTRVYSDNAYRYAVKVKYDTGSESLMSDEVSYSL